MKTKNHSQELPTDVLAGLEDLIVGLAVATETLQAVAESALNSPIILLPNFGNEPQH